MNAPLKAILDEHHELLVYNMVHQLSVPEAGHYRKLQGQELRVRVEELCTAFAAAVATGGDAFVEHILAISRERVAEGYALREVQLALRVFEENIWRLVTVHVPLEQQVACLALATGIVGRAKDELAESYLVLLELSEARQARAADRTQVIAQGTDSAPLTEEDRAASGRKWPR